MGIFNALSSIGTCNNILARIEYKFGILESHVNNGNRIEAGLVLGEIRDLVGQFIVTLDNSSGARIAMFKFYGVPKKGVELILILTDLVNDLRNKLGIVFD